jgi:hypothetical protein
MTGTQQAEESSVAESCAGTGGPAVEGSVLQKGATRKTGECPLCGGRVRLGGDARLLDHAAEAAER